MRDFDDDGWDESDRNVHRPEDNKPRLCSRMCNSCILRPRGKGQIPLRADRVAEVIGSAVQRDSYVICHATLGTGASAICRGFYDRYSTNYLRVMGRLGGFVEIDPPGKEAA